MIYFAVIDLHKFDGPGTTIPPFNRKCLASMNRWLITAWLSIAWDFRKIQFPKLTDKITTTGKRIVINILWQQYRSANKRTGEMRKSPKLDTKWKKEKKKREKKTSSLIRRKPANRVLYTKRKPGSQKLFFFFFSLGHWKNFLLRYYHYYTSATVCRVVVRGKKKKYWTSFAKLENYPCQIHQMKWNSRRNTFA